MIPVFDPVNNEFCSLCKKKKTWLLRIYVKGKQNILNIICHECINQMGFELSKSMKPENFEF